jgi:hypothetical protein
MSDVAYRTADVDGLTVFSLTWTTPWVGTPGMVVLFYCLDWLTAQNM